jgi:hypothetical protein
MEIDTQIARVKDLIARREEIDAELAGILGIAPKFESRCGARLATRKGTRRGRVPKGRPSENDGPLRRPVTTSAVAVS